MIKSISQLKRVLELHNVNIRPSRRKNDGPDASLTVASKPGQPRVAVDLAHDQREGTIFGVQIERGIGAPGTVRVEYFTAFDDLWFYLAHILNTPLSCQIATSTRTS